MTDKELARQKSEDGKINRALAGLMLSMLDAANAKQEPLIQNIFELGCKVFLSNPGYTERLREHIKDNAAAQMKLKKPSIQVVPS